MLDIKPAWEPDSFKFIQNNFQCDGDCRVVGVDDHSERLIVAWNRWPDLIEDSDGVAVKIGLFNVKTTDIEVLFTSSEQLHVVHCTVDANLKTLAMVCKTLPSYGFDYNGSSHLAKPAEVTFSCYWTPLSISEEEFISVLPLNKESDQMMKVQLLSSNQLLILNPREAIYLYTLPACEQIGYHNTMTSPVLYERLVGPFLWAEYNVTACQLFYVHLKNNNSKSSNELSSGTNNEVNKLNAVLEGLKFHGGTVFEIVLQTQIDLLCQISSANEKSDFVQMTASFNPLVNKIYNPVLKMEMSICTKSEGEVYIFQGIVETKEENASNNEEEVDIKYDINLLHHSCTLHCRVKDSFRSHGTNKKIMFVPTQDSILVLMPGVFTHLLDIGLEHEPCNHILLRGCELPQIGEQEYGEFILTSSNQTKKTLSYIVCSSEEIRHLRVSVTNQSLMETFNSDDLIGTTIHQCIIHHMLIHCNDIVNVEKLLRNLKMESTDPNVVKLFQEFLIGGAYFHTRHRTDKRFCHLLPISAAEPFHPQHETFLDGSLKMSTSYTLIKNMKSVILSPTERHVTHHRVADLWFRLWQHLRTRPLYSHTNTLSRFSSKAMRDELLSRGSERRVCEEQHSSEIHFLSKSFCPLSCISQECSAHPAASFCRQFLGASEEKKAVEALENAVLKVSISDEELEETCEDCYSKLEQIISLNLRELTIHLSKHLPATLPNVIKEFASSYVADRLDQSQILCRIIFDLANIRSSTQKLDDHDPYVFINNLPSTVARNLFSWLERYLVAAEEMVFPLPKGFEAFFSVLAYKCLNIRMFLQYVDFGVVQLTSEVLRCITTDAKAVVNTMPQSQLYDDNVMVEIISRLPKDTAIHFLQHLKCHTTRLLQVHHIVERYCNHQCSLKKNDKQSDSSKACVETKMNKQIYASELIHHLENKNSISDSDSDDEYDFNACTSETLELPTPIITAMTSFMCFLQEGDLYTNLYANPDKSNFKPKSVPVSRHQCASASDMKFIKETQLRNIASEGSNRPLQPSKFRPHVPYWR